MRFFRRIVFISVTVLALSVGIAVRPAAAADTFCQCGTYVKNYYNLGFTFAAAKDLETLLPQHGWTRRTGMFQVGDIAVWQPGEPGGSAPYGHTSIIAAISTSSQGVSVKYRGANQGPDGWFSSAGCYNVNYLYSLTTWSYAAFFYR